MSTRFVSRSKTVGLSLYRVAGGRVLSMWRTVGRSSAYVSWVLVKPEVREKRSAHCHPHRDNGYPTPNRKGSPLLLTFTATSLPLYTPANTSPDAPLPSRSPRTTSCLGISEKEVLYSLFLGPGTDRAREQGKGRRSRLWMSCRVPRLARTHSQLCYVRAVRRVSSLFTTETLLIWRRRVIHQAVATLHVHIAEERDATIIRRQAQHCCSALQARPPYE